MKRIGLALAASLTACVSNPAPSAPAPQAAIMGVQQSGLERMPLRIRTDSGVHRFTVEVARTPEQHEHGMKFRTSVGRNAGMIFPTDPPDYVGFWMKDTLIPLDLLFIRADGTIAQIATGQPHDETLIESIEPVAAVLEIRGGRAAELGIRPGDRVEWSG